jgi:hypothetical protein
MTTVGYGDFYPKTILGRFVGYCAAFVGVTLESLAMVTFSNALLMERSQWTAYIMLRALWKKDKLKKRAGECLVATYRLKHSSEKKKLQAMRKYSRKSQLFRSKAKQIRANNMLEPNLEQKIAVSSLRKEIDEVNHLMKAFSKLVKVKKFSINGNNSSSSKYEIPGYSEPKIMTFQKPIDHNTIKILDNLDDTESREDSESYLMNESASISSFIDSSIPLYYKK